MPPPRLRRTLPALFLYRPVIVPISSTLCLQCRRRGRQITTTTTTTIADDVRIPPQARQPPPPPPPPTPPPSSAPNPTQNGNENGDGKPNSSSSSSSTSKKKRSLRPLLTFSAYYLLGALLGTAFSGLIKPPPFPALGSKADDKLRERLYAEMEGLDVVREMVAAGGDDDDDSGGGEGRRRRWVELRVRDDEVPYSLGPGSVSGSAFGAGAGAGKGRGKRDREGWWQGSSADDGRVPTTTPPPPPASPSPLWDEALLKKEEEEMGIREVAHKYASRSFTGESIAGWKGLAVARSFYSPADRALVRVVWIGPGMTGWPGVVHGGVTCTVLEEVMGRLVGLEELAAPRPSLSSSSSSSLSSISQVGSAGAGDAASMAAEEERRLQQAGIVQPDSISLTYVKRATPHAFYVVRASLLDGEMGDGLAGEKAEEATRHIETSKDMTKQKQPVEQRAGLFGGGVGVRVLGTVERLDGTICVKAVGQWERQ